MIRFGEVWRQPRLVVECTVGFVALGTVFYSWLGLSESGIAQLGLSLLALIVLAAGLFGLHLRAARRMGGSTEPASMGSRVLAVAVFLVFTYIAWRLIWWVPSIESFAGQVASMILRFGLAYGLAITGWLNTVAVWSRRRGSAVTS